MEGFDNIAAALSVSPAFLDQYVTAARHVARLAVGSPNPRVSSVKYSIAANQNPDDPLPLGTRDGIKIQTQLPDRRRVSHHDKRPCSGTVQRCPGESEHARHHDRWPDRVSQADRRAGGSGSRRSHGRDRTRSDHGALFEDSRAGPSRSARRGGGVHRPFPCGDKRQLPKTGRLQRLDRQPGPSRSKGPSSRRCRDRWTVRSQRRFENGQPGADLRLRSQDKSCTRRVRLRPADHGKPGETRLPAAGYGGRHEAPHAVL